MFISDVDYTTWLLRWRRGHLLCVRSVASRLLAQTPRLVSPFIPQSSPISLSLSLYLPWMTRRQWRQILHHEERLHVVGNRSGLIKCPFLGHVHWLPPVSSGEADFEETLERRASVLLLPTHKVSLNLDSLCGFEFLGFQFGFDAFKVQTKRRAMVKISHSSIGRRCTWSFWSRGIKQQGRDLGAESLLKHSHTWRWRRQYVVWCVKMISPRKPGQWY